MKKPLRTEVGKGFSSCTSCMMFLGIECLSLAFLGLACLEAKASRSDDRHFLNFALTDVAHVRPTFRSEPPPLAECVVPASHFVKEIHGATVDLVLPLLTPCTRCHSPARTSHSTLCRLASTFIRQAAKPSIALEPLCSALVRLLLVESPSLLPPQLPGWINGSQ